MKISEMKETIEREFPGIYTSFQIEVNHHGTISGCKAEARVCIYTPSIGFVRGRSFTECVSILKAILSKPEALADEDVSFDFGANKI